MGNIILPPELQRTKSLRLAEHDYCLPGHYFVTVCVKDRIKWFGKISDSKMELSKYGKIAEERLLDVPNHLPYVEIDKYIILPNKIHLITVIHAVENTLACSGQASKVIRRNNELLPVIIGSFKSSVSKLIHRERYGKDFNWQKSYLDRIIRDFEDLERMRRYIQNIPMNWNDYIDRFQ